VSGHFAPSAAAGRRAARAAQAHERCENCRDEHGENRSTKCLHTYTLKENEPGPLGPGSLVLLVALVTP
ncbi:MAG: hypothetical protein QOI61_1079, partial [Actinomycetota bacterium]